MTHEGLIHNKEEYPDHNDLGNQKDLIYEKNWDLLIVLDACRWDALNEMVEDDVKKVRTPAERSTPDWVSRMWSSDTWSDTTYVTGSPWSIKVKDMDRYGVDVEEYFGHVEKVFEDGWDDIDKTVRPDEMNDRVKDFEPPVVAHYIQPHTPFIGKLAINCSGGLEPQFVNKSSKDDLGNGIIYSAVEEGLIAPHLVRRAYMDNLELVWNYIQNLRSEFDSIVVTADHGEALGPRDWSHGGMEDPRNRVVPWLEL